MKNHHRLLLFSLMLATLAPSHAGPSAPLEEDKPQEELDKQRIQKMRMEQYLLKIKRQALASIIQGGMYTDADRDAHVAQAIAEFPAEEQAEWRALADRLIQEQAAAELTWTQPTTNDRIAAAFKRFNASGIIALANAGFTQSDAWATAHEIRTSSMPDARGTVFFTSQAIHRGVDGKGLSLGWGPFYDDEREDAATLALGREIVRVLTEEGVAVTWGERLDRTIEIDPFEWQQRRGTLLTPKTKADEYMGRPGWQR